MDIFDQVAAERGIAPRSASFQRLPVRPLPKPGFLEHAGKHVLSGALNIGSAFGSLGKGIAENLGMDDLAYNLGGRLEQVDRYQQHLAEEVGPQQALIQGPDSVYEKWQRGEATMGDLGHGVFDLVTTQLPQFAVGGVGMKLGKAALTPILARSMTPKVAAYTGALAGSTGLMAAQETGSIYQEQPEGQKDLGKAALMGIPAGALEAAGQLYGMGKSGVGRFVSQELAPSVKRGAMDLLKDTGKVALSEGLTEGSQNVLEQYGRQPGWNAPALDVPEFLENAIGGFALGGGIHGAVAPMDNYFLGRREDAIQRGKKAAQAEFDAKQAVVQQQHVNDIKAGIAPATILPDAPPVEQTARSMRDGEKLSAIEGERQAVSLQEKRATMDVYGDTEQRLDNGYLHDLVKDGNPHAQAELDRRYINEAYLDLKNYGAFTDPETGPFNRDELQYLLETIDRHEAYNPTGARDAFRQQVVSAIERADNNILEGGNTYGQVQGWGQEEIENTGEAAPPSYHEQLAQDVQHPVIQSAASALNKLNEERGSAVVAPEYLVNAAKKLYRTVQSVKDFTLGLVERFGDAIKPHALKLWNWVKTLQPGLSVESVDDQGQRVSLADVVGKQAPANPYINHSGGAKGADTEWDRIGRELGFTNHNHYREPKAASVDSPELRSLGVKPVNMTPAEWQEGTQMADQAAKDLGRPLPSKQQYGYYAIRNWLQVKNADAVFAVGQVIKPGEKDSKGFVNKTDKPIVAGGTGYAAQMAINSGKPLYIYDQKRGFWIQNIDGKWAKTDTPTLTPNYAGIGTREITDAGKQAIRDVYQKTLGQDASAIESPPALQSPTSTGAVENNAGQGIPTPASAKESVSRVVPGRDNGVSETDLEYFKRTGNIRHDADEWKKLEQRLPEITPRISENNRFLDEEFGEPFLDEEGRQTLLDENSAQTIKAIRKEAKEREIDSTVDMPGDEEPSDEMVTWEQSLNRRKQGDGVKNLDQLGRPLDYSDETSSIIKDDLDEIDRLPPAYRSASKALQANVGKQLTAETQAKSQKLRDAYDAHVDEQVGALEKILLIKNLWRESTSDPDNPRMMYEVLGDVLRNLGRERDIDQVLKYITRKDGQPHTWEEIPQSLFDMAERVFNDNRPDWEMHNEVIDNPGHWFTDPEAFSAVETAIKETTGRNHSDSLRAVKKVLANPDRFLEFYGKYELDPANFKRVYGTPIDGKVLQALADNIDVMKFRESIEGGNKPINLKHDNLGNILLDREGKPIPIEPVERRPAKEGEIADLKPRTAEEIRKANEDHFASLDKLDKENSMVHSLIPPVFKVMAELNNSNRDRMASQILTPEVVLKRIWFQLTPEEKTELNKLPKEKQLDLISQVINRSTVEDGMFDYYWTSPEARGEQGKPTEVLKNVDGLTNGEPDIETKYPVAENTENKAPGVDNADPFFRPFEVDERPDSLPLFNIAEYEKGGKSKAEDFQPIFSVSYQTMEKNGSLRRREHNASLVKIREMQANPEQYRNLEILGQKTRDGRTVPTTTDRMQVMQNWEYGNTMERRIRRAMQDSVITDEAGEQMLQRLQAAGTMSGAERAQAVRTLDQDMTQLKIDIVQKAFAVDRLNLKQHFIGDAAKLKEQGIEIAPAELYAYFRNSGGSMMAYNNKLSELVRGQVAKLSQHEVPTKVKSIVEELSQLPKKPTLVAEERKQIEDSIAKLQAIPYDIAENRYQRDLAVVRLKARLAENEKQAAALKGEEEQIHTDMRAQAYAAALDAPVEAIFQPKETLDAKDQKIEQHFSSPENPVRVGFFRNSLAQKFFDGLSGLFGARTIVINDNDGGFKGGYFPNTSHGPAIVINANSGLSLTRVFAHELFHHMVNKIAPDVYAEFSKALDKSVARNAWDRARNDLLNRGITDYREELHSEIFAEAMQHPAFWQTLSETKAGKTLAGKLAIGLMEHITKVVDYLKKFGKGAKELEDNQIRNLITDWYGIANGQGNVYRMLSNIVNQAYLSDKLNHQNIKQHIFNKTSVDELKGYGATIGNYLNDNFQKVWPKDSPWYKKGFKLVENIFHNMAEFAKKHHPKGLFEDVGRDQQAVFLAHKAMYGANLELDHIQKSVIDKYAKVWDGLSESKLEDLHDAIVRKGIDVTSEAGKAAAKKIGLNDQQIEVFAEYKRMADDIHTQLAEVIPDLKYRPTHYGQSIRWYRDGKLLDDSFDWAVNDEFSKLEGNKRYLKEKAEERTTKDIKADGLSYRRINPHELFMDYARDAYKLIAFRKMVEEGKKLTDKNGNPYIKWFDFDQKAAAKGYFPIADNATKIMQTFNLPEGYKINLGDGTYYKDGQNDVVFPTLGAAQDIMNSYAKKRGLDVSQMSVEQLHGDKQHDVRGYSVIEKIDKIVQEGLSFTEARSYADELKEAGKVAFVNKAGKKWNVLERSYQELDRFQDSEEAQALLSKIEGENRQGYIKPKETSEESNTVASRLYFNKDLGRMINVMLAPDRLRRANFFGLSGDKLLSAKNWATALELFGALYHAMTIGQESTASDAAWYQARYGMLNAYKSFNPRRTIRDTKELNRLFERIVASEDAAKDPELLKEANRILGTANVDALDIVHQYYKFGGRPFGQDTELRTGFANLGNIDYTSFKTFAKSMGDAYRKETARIPDAPLRSMFNKTMFTLSQPMTQWLMEQGIPKVKMAMFAKEYTLKLDQNREALKLGTKTREELARDTMKFIEDRFGEVNWKNMWLDPTYKSSLQFLFRSFTWFTGSWKALGKAGIDMGKLGWYRVQGKEYHLTEKGRWGINVFLAHMMTAGLISAAYNLSAAINGDEVPTPEDVPLLTRMLFPRNDRLDPQSRLSIPSYVTEAFKIFMHLGGGGGGMEPTKLVSGRFNSLLSNALDVWMNEDYRGVTIRDGNPAKQAVQSAMHILGVAPIMVSTIYKESRDKGFDPLKLPVAFMGMTDAPAAAKRSVATNKAFELRREEFKGKKIEPEEMEEKDKLKRAMYQYQQGDRSQVDEMLASGELSKRKFDIALTRMPQINRQNNPKYLDPLSQAFKGLTIDGKLKVWTKMSDNEKKKHRPELMKTYYNMMSRQDKSPNEKLEARDKMREFGLL